jgi:hypothetical protein
MAEAMSVGEILREMGWDRAIKERGMLEKIEIDLCVDCLMATSGLLEDADPGWGGMLEEWNGWLFGYLFDPETEEPQEPHFSWSPCQGCGSGLGGDRYPHEAVRV